MSWGHHYGDPTRDHRIPSLVAISATSLACYLPLRWLVNISAEPLILVVCPGVVMMLAPAEAWLGARL